MGGGNHISEVNNILIPSTGSGVLVSVIVYKRSSATSLTNLEVCDFDKLPSVRDTKENNFLIDFVTIRDLDTNYGLYQCRNVLLDYPSSAGVGGSIFYTNTLGERNPNNIVYGNYIQYIEKANKGYISITPGKRFIYKWVLVDLCSTKQNVETKIINL